jgi:uncharacterized membrane protein
VSTEITDSASAREPAVTAASEPLDDVGDVDDLQVDLDAPNEHQLAGGANRGLSLTLVIGGLIGFIASFALMFERLELLKDPEHIPSCDFGHAVISCASVMETSQAQAFGFPNPLLGIAAFAAVVGIGMALATGARVPRWFWLGLQAGSLFGIGFVTWLQHQSLYSIGSLCPYCMVVWVVMIPIFVAVTAHNVQAGHLRVSTGVRNTIVRNQALIVLLWYVVIAAAILIRFWEDFFPA